MRNQPPADEPCFGVAGAGRVLAGSRAALDAEPCRMCVPAAKASHARASPRAFSAYPIDSIASTARGQYVFFRRR